ncbi:MAG: outer membrane beta-barrel protein [Verrucomicrobiota bacterium]
MKSSTKNVKLRDHSQEIKIQDTSSSESEKIDTRLHDRNSASSQDILDFKFHPHLKVREEYNDNFLTLSENPQGDLISTFSPGFSVESGKMDEQNSRYDKIWASYTTRIVRFLDKTKNNAVDQDAELKARYNLSRLTLFLDQTAQTLSDNELDTGTRSSRDVYETHLKARYDFHENIFIEPHAQQAVTNYSNIYNDRIQWEGGSFIGWKLSPLTIFQIGINVGVWDVENNPNQMYEQLISGVHWQASKRFAIDLAAGSELRQWQDDVVDERATPIFSFGATYAPTQRTEFQLEAFRGIKSSALRSGQNYTSMELTFSAQQRIADRWAGQIEAAYERASYYRASNKPFTARQDDFVTLRPSCSYQFADLGKAEVFYQFRNRTSNQSEMEFENNIYGMEVQLRY